MKETPTFPIKINGNILDSSTKLATEPLETKHVLVQSLARLRPSDRQELDRAGVTHLDYVSKNTYLFQYLVGIRERFVSWNLSSMWIFIRKNSRSRPV